MTKMDLAIKALTDVPADRQDEIADLVLELTAAVQPEGSVLTPEQLAEVRRRRTEGFKRGDPSRIDRMLARNEG